MRHVAVVLRAEPTTGDRLAEGLRNALGFTLARENRVSVYFLTPARPALVSPLPCYRRPIDGLRACRARLVVEGGACGDAAPASRDDIYAELSDCDAITCW